MVNSSNSLIPEIITTSRLISVRFARILAEKVNGAITGGTLIVDASAALSPFKGNDSQAICTVTLAARGVPKGADETSLDIAFKALIEIRGVYRWPNAVVREALEDKEFVQTLAQPLYLLASHRIVSSLEDIGLKNIEIGVDLRKLGDSDSGEPAHVTEHQISATKAAKPLRKKARPKPSVVTGKEIS